MADDAARVAAAEAQRDFFRELIGTVQGLQNQRAPATKSIPCEVYRQGQDFDQYITLFIDNICAVHNIAKTDDQLGRLCVKWLPTKLESGATRSVYDNLADTVQRDWAQLRPALSAAFRDESEEIRFINNENAWKRSPGMSLKDYRNGLILRLDKYQPDLKTVNNEWQRAAVRRFRAGLENPVLSCHILMNCTGERHTLNDAFNIAANFENTLQTIGHGSMGSKMVDPTMAGLLTIPQMASLSLETPQFSALSPQQEKTDRRLEAVETSLKAQELNMTELKAGLGEMKENVLAIKGEVTQAKYKPNFQRQLRPVYPMQSMIRGPAQNPFSRSYPQYPKTPFNRPRLVPGLTGGPGYMSHLPTPFGHQGQTAGQTQAQNPSNVQTKPAESAKPPGEVPVPTLGAMSEGNADRGESEQAQFANPHLQYGFNDTGFGWTGCNLSEAQNYGYDIDPSGVYAYSEMPYNF